MDRWPPTQTRRGPHGIADALRPHAKMLGLAGVAAAPILAVAAVVPAPLVLPTFSLFALASAGVAALHAWRRAAGQDRRGLTSWDVAGGLALIGFVAATLGEPDAVARLVEVAAATG